MSKNPINEGLVSKFVSNFLNNVQKDTQKRFIKQAKEKGMPPKIISKMEKIEDEIRDLEKIIKDFS
jgi:hypothetical protein